MVSLNKKRWSTWICTPPKSGKKSKNLWNHWGFLCWVYLNSSFLSLPHEFHPAGSYLVGMEPSHRKLNFLPFSTSPFRLRSGDIGGYFRSPCQRKHLKEKSRVKMRIDHQPDLSLLVPCFPQNSCHQKWTSCIEDMNFLEPILQTTLRHLHPFIISTFTSWWFQPIKRILVKMGIFPE